MTNRTDHLFQFAAADIAAAAQREADYHLERADYWTHQRDLAATQVRATIGATLVWHPHTNGGSWITAVDYGDPAAQKRLGEAQAKLERHTDDRDRYQSDARLYGTQNGRVYELDADDVMHFRLGGQPRED